MMIDGYSSYEAALQALRLMDKNNIGYAWIFISPPPRQDLDEAEAQEWAVYVNDGP